MNNKLWIEIELDGIEDRPMPTEQIDWCSNNCEGVWNLEAWRQKTFIEQ